MFRSHLWMMLIIFIFLLSAEQRAQAAPADDGFMDIVNSLISQNEKPNVLSEDHELKGISGDLIRLKSSAFPTLSISTFAREYYLNQPQIDLSQYSVLTTQNVMGVGISVNQDLMGLLTGGYSFIAKPLENNEKLIAEGDRAEKTRRYLTGFLSYIQHSRRQARIAKAIKLLESAKKHRDTQASGTDKILVKMNLEATLEELRQAEYMEEVLVKRYAALFERSALKRQSNWVRENGPSLDISALANSLKDLKGDHDFQEHLKQKMDRNLADELEARKSIDWMDNLSFSLSFSGDVYGDSLENAESYGLVSINYAFDDPSRKVLELQREQLSHEKIDADNEDFNFDETELQREGYAHMSKDEFMNAVKNWERIDKDFNDLFTLARAGVYRNSEMIQSVSVWLSAADNLEATLWGKMTELLVAHQCLAIAGQV